MLKLAPSGLDTLANGFHYEGWAIVGGQPRSTGAFNVDANGGLVTPGGVAIADGTFTPAFALDQATEIVITVEPANDSDPGPSATHILAGALQAGTAHLTIADAAALGSDFSSAAGSFILATPTDGPNSHEKSGLWFLAIANMMPGPALTLPTLPAGWKYEGWAVVNGTPITTGKFLPASGDDESAPYSGTMPGPPFPGEDFLMNAPSGLTFPLDLSGGKAVVSVEPDPDDSPTPFSIKPLVGSIPSDAGDHASYPLDNHAAAAPTMTATVL